MKSLQQILEVLKVARKEVATTLELRNQCLEQSVEWFQAHQHYQEALHEWDKVNFDLVLAHREKEKIKNVHFN